MATGREQSQEWQKQQKSLHRPTLNASTSYLGLQQRTNATGSLVDNFRNQLQFFIKLINIVLQPEELHRIVLRGAFLKMVAQRAKLRIQKIEPVLQRFADCCGPYCRDPLVQGGKRSSRVV